MRRDEEITRGIWRQRREEWAFKTVVWLCVYALIIGIVVANCSG